MLWSRRRGAGWRLCFGGGRYRLLSWWGFRWRRRRRRRGRVLFAFFSFLAFCARDEKRITESHVNSRHCSPYFASTMFDIKKHHFFAPHLKTLNRSQHDKRRAKIEPTSMRGTVAFDVVVDHHVLGINETKTNPRRHCFQHSTSSRSSQQNLNDATRRRTARRHMAPMASLSYTSTSKAKCISQV
jgi:hypothetical protein